MEDPSGALRIVHISPDGSEQELSYTTQVRAGGTSYAIRHATLMAGEQALVLLLWLGAFIAILAGMAASGGEARQYIVAIGAICLLRPLCTLCGAQRLLTLRPVKQAPSAARPSLCLCRGTPLACKCCSR